MNSFLNLKCSSVSYIHDNNYYFRMECYKIVNGKKKKYIFKSQKYLSDEYKVSSEVNSSVYLDLDDYDK